MSELVIGGESILPGEVRNIHLKAGRLFDYTELQMPLRVIRGINPGPVVFISGGIHGDEVVGPEIVKRVINHSRLKIKNGTLIAIPIVNVFGYNSMSRYLPDRRDLNRSFPGSEKGSLASRLANTFVKEILMKCDVGIDLHSAAIHRNNLPQIRANLRDDETSTLANIFNVPVILHSEHRDGSLREAARELGVKMLVFEGGEGLRVDESVVKTGIKGIFNILRKLDMLKKSNIAVKEKKNTYMAKSSHWLRASQGGAIRIVKTLGSTVTPGMKLATISDTFGNNRMEIQAKSSGVIIGITTLPLVNPGDAIFHIATFDKLTDIDEISEDYSDILSN